MGALDELIGQGHTLSSGGTAAAVQNTAGGPLSQQAMHLVVPGNSGVNAGPVETIPVRRGSAPASDASSVDVAENYWQVTHQHFSAALPPEFKYYLQYCRSLRFEDAPDYGYLRRLIKDVFFREQFTLDRLFDWTPGGLPAKFQHGRDPRALQDAPQTNTNGNQQQQYLIGGTYHRKDEKAQQQQQLRHERERHVGQKN